VSFIALLAAALAPAGKNHFQPAGAVAGVFGLMLSAWVGWYAHAIPLADADTKPARARMRARERALRILREDPKLATELKIGRPDLTRDFDDGGLVDVNQVPASVLTTLDGIDGGLAERIVSVRKSVGEFDSTGDLESVLDLPPKLLDRVRDRLAYSHNS
jgi:hypothetical protein